jgi:hypothetical protein
LLRLKIDPDLGRVELPAKRLLPSPSLASSKSDVRVR